MPDFSVVQVAVFVSLGVMVVVVACCLISGGGGDDE